MRGAVTTESRPTLEWAEHAGAACLRLTGLASDARDLDLAVLPGEIASLAPRLQPMVGHFAESSAGMDFIPRFPFVGGTTYSLVIAPCADFPAGCVLSLRREAAAIAATAAVSAVYPDVDIAPFNLLKLYVHFSEPMAEGAARRGVRVENARTGESLENVFLDMDPELWDRERRRLTLLLDPGRIKRGLAPHQEAGYPLTEGVPIRITIGAGFVSAAGAPLRSPFSRVYAVGPALRRPIDPSDWRVDAPAQGSSAPLTLTFDRPLDHALLSHAFRVLDTDGHAIGGAGVALAGERVWAFHPSQAWLPGEHQLIIDARLEDLAGNSLRRVFDRDLTRESDRVTEAEHVALTFDCAPRRP